MPVFAYKATDEQGRVVNGQIEAKNTEAVVDRLQRLSFYPLEIKTAERISGRRGLPFALMWKKGKKVSLFTTQLSTLLDAGLPVDKSLAIMQELTEDEKFGGIIADVRQSVEEGNSLAEGLEDQKAYFNDLYVNMVRAGESGGVLETVLQRLSNFLEESQKMKDFIVSSLTYPVFLVIFSMLALIVIFTSVLPRFARIFDDMGEVLPLPARVLMNISHFIGAYWWVMVLGAVAAAAAFVSFVRTARGRLWWDRSRLTWPLLGVLTSKHETARFARTLGTLMASGVPILQAVDIVGETIGNRHMSSFMGDVKEGLKKGEGLVAPIARAGVFPPLFIHMSTVGEETGRLEEMLIKVAEIFEGEIEARTKSLLSILEPVILVLIGIVLGSIIISILWAIFSVYQISF